MADQINVNIVTGTGESTIEAEVNLWQQKFALINDYLRFFLVAILLGLIIYGGFLLISAQGDEAKLKKANMLLVFGLIGIFVAIFAGALVKLIVNFVG